MILLATPGVTAFGSILQHGQQTLSPTYLLKPKDAGTAPSPPLPKQMPQSTRESEISVYRQAKWSNSRFFRMCDWETAWYAIGNIENCERAIKDPCSPSRSKLLNVLNKKLLDNLSFGEEFETSTRESARKIFDVVPRSDLSSAFGPRWQASSRQRCSRFVSSGFYWSSNFSSRPSRYISLIALV